MSLGGNKRAITTARVGAARLGATRLGFTPQDTVGGESDGGINRYYQWFERVRSSLTAAIWTKRR